MISFIRQGFIGKLVSSNGYFGLLFWAVWSPQMGLLVSSFGLWSPQMGLLVSSFGVGRYPIEKPIFADTAGLSARASKCLIELNFFLFRGGVRREPIFLHTGVPFPASGWLSPQKGVGVSSKGGKIPPRSFIGGSPDFLYNKRG